MPAPPPVRRTAGPRARELGRRQQAPRRRCGPAWRRSRRLSGRLPKRSLARGGQVGCGDGAGRCAECRATRRIAGGRSAAAAPHTPFLRPSFLCSFVCVRAASSPPASRAVIRTPAQHYSSTAYGGRMGWLPIT
eukprot:67506-Chlamydomonas_euryale.AAC.12